MFWCVTEVWQTKVKEKVITSNLNLLEGHVFFSFRNLRPVPDHVCVCVCVCERERERKRERENFFLFLLREFFPTTKVLKQCPMTY